MIRLTQNDWRIFRRLQRKHNVSTEFLRYNLENIQKFIWYETWPRIVIKRYAIRKGQRVFIVYYRLRRVLFDQSNRKLFKRMRQNVRQWSKRMVQYQKNHQGIKEYIEEIVNESVNEGVKDMETEKEQEKKKELEVAVAVKTSNAEDVSKQLKEQLELLKNGRRQQTLINNSKKSEDTTMAIEKEPEKLVEKEKTIDDTQNPQTTDSSKIDDVRKKLKEQLENIKIQRNKAVTLDTTTKSKISEDKDNNTLERGKTPESPKEWQINLESTPEKQITTQENTQPVKQLATDEKTEKSHTEDDIIKANSQQTDKLKTGLNFLDMLMCKVTGGQNTNTTKSSKQDEQQLKSNTSFSSPPSSAVKDSLQHYSEISSDSTDGFLGFDDCERLPGMLMTPIVPHSTRNNKNSAFVSESLNEYMRVNDLETSYNIDEDKSVSKGKIFARFMEGLMTPSAKPPPFDMPAVPENLLKYRTVAERKQYLQKFSKNYRLSIINNEAMIYRELQRKIRIQKVKSASQQLAQSASSSMSFTRYGWYAASFINTDFNNFYYQMLDVDRGAHLVRLKGVRGNNDEFHKTPYISKVKKPSKECPTNCVDERNWQDLKPIKTITSSSKKLNKHPLPSVFKPCPLSHKPLQKPLDDDTAALLLAGGSMAVVRMPTVELEVFPEQGKPLHEIAKRYLQYILPHHDISREWAEFSVSTLQQPSRRQTIKEVEEAAAKKFNPLDLRKSYTFVIPYLNDRNHILVRRVVDRSEKLDQSFEKCLDDEELVPKTDFTFRQKLDESSDDVLLACADVVSDMINTVAISCSENSFIKKDPDGIETIEANNKQTVAKQEKVIGRPPNTVAPKNEEIGPIKKIKQRSLLNELKRLNATIIDAAVKPEIDTKPCSKDFCAMGCICVSLTEAQPMREHCGKTKCMLECTCKSANQSRIMRLETDGRTITTEDAFMLRRKATARLARMEKEFTSTIVLTENETLLINETNNDKKRRCTKAPKRYEDFADTDDERRISPKKATDTSAASALTTIDNENSLAVDIKELREPVYVQDSILEQLKHCTVNLVPLQNMENVAHWCMIHNLYKCFCKGRAVEGKPMIIEKEEVNTTIEHTGEQTLEQLEYSTSVKAKYTFDKVEKRKKSRDSDNDDDDEDNSDNEDEEEEEEEYNNKWRSKQKKFKKKDGKEKQESLLKSPTVINEAESDNMQQLKSDEDAEESVDEEYTTQAIKKTNKVDKHKPKRNLLEVRKRFYLSRLDCCRRQIPIPRRMFLYCNRKRRGNVLSFIKKNENEQTRLLLNEHIMRSVYYHKIDAGNQKNTEEKVSTTEELEKSKEKLATTSNPITSTPISATTVNTVKRNYLLANEVVDLLEDEDDDQQNIPSHNDIEENTQLSSSTTKSCTSYEKILPDEVTTRDTANLLLRPNNPEVITVKGFATFSGVSAENTPSTAAADNPSETLRLPKISSCFSLNVEANQPKPSDTANTEKQNLDFTSATTVHSAAFSQSTYEQAHHSQSQVMAQGASVHAKDGSTVLSIDMNNENVKDVYNSVIKTMNSLVSKKMQDIDFALKRESHIIPVPNADILCIMKWSNFLDAFCEGFAYIWQVKMKDVTYFVATIRNIMPMIAGALGIVNITALKADKMPLMGRMLLQRIRNTETLRLAIVMQGKVSHWVVKGFLRAEPTTACNKPTPDTHPSLTKKINVLCSLLVKQRQKDEKKKEKEKEKPGSQWISPQMANAKQKIAQIMPTPRATIAASQARNPSQILQNPKQIQNQPMQMQNAIQIQNQPMQLQNVTQIQNQPMQMQNVIHIQNQPMQIQNSTQNLSQHIRNSSYQQNSPYLQNSTQIQNSPHMQKSIQIQNSSQMQNSSQNLNLPQTQNSPYMQNSQLTKPINKTMDTSKESPLQKATRKRKSTDSTATPNSSMKMDFYAKMNSNIEFRKVSQSDINEIHLPELHRKDHKWLVLDLHNDFSHIFVPEFQDLVSLDRIQKVINFAKQKNKIVKLQFFQNAPFDAFVTPKSGRKIYFGPLTMDMKPPTLILLQSVDGQMMLRELYQLQHNIQTRNEEKTKAFWLLQLKGHTHFEVDLKVGNKKPNEEATPIGNVPAPLELLKFRKELAKPLPIPQETGVKPTLTQETSITKLLPPEITVQSETNKNAEDDDDDEDCMIIDETEDNIVNTPTDNQERYNFTIKSVSDSVSIIPQTNSLPGPPPIKTLKMTKSNNIETTKLNMANNTNTINTLNPITSTSVMQMPIITGTSTTLPLLTLPPNTVITGITPPNTAMDISTNTTTLPVMNLPTNAVITSITQAPQEASYGSTIFISSTDTIDMDSIISPQKSNVETNKTTTKPMAQIQPEVQIIATEEPTKSNANESNEAATIKRRRISLYCSNKYDKMSKNIAVDAVLNKILPDNAEDIQINPISTVNEIPTKTATNTSETVSTIGSTTITKMADKNPQEALNIPSNIEELSSIRTKMPIVFDVNFMDEGDEEPTASIVIKPTLPDKEQDVPSVVQNVAPKCVTKVVPKVVKNDVRNVIHIQSNQKLPTISPQTYRIPNLPNHIMTSAQTQNNTTNKVTSTTGSTTKILNSLLSSKTTTITPKPRYIQPKPTVAVSTNSTSTITTPRTSLTTSSFSSNIPISRPSLQSSLTISGGNTSTTAAVTTAAASPIPVKIHKIVNTSSSSAVKIQTSTAMITKTPVVKSTLSNTLNQKSSPAGATKTAVHIQHVQDITKPSIDLTKSRSGPTVTIKQVQDMLTKPTVDLTAATSTTKTSTTSLPNTSIQTVPIVKAIVTQSKVVTPQIVSVTSTALTSSSSPCVSNTSITSTYSSPSSNLTLSSTPTSTTVINSNTPSTSTLTISKVQSFGSPSKQIKDRTTTNVQSVFTPPPSSSSPSQINSNNSTSNNDDRLVNPPSHIQYGYIVSAAHPAQKFVAKRVVEEFYVKVPLVGIVKLQASAVNNYLNRYMLKNCKDYKSTQVTWRFVAASKDVQMQNHQKSLLVRKTKSSTSSANPNKAGNVSSTDEPILIDD